MEDNLLNHQCVLGRLTLFHYTYFTDAQTVYPEACQAANFDILINTFIVSN